MDEDGNLVDSLLQEHRDRESAQAFFEQALEMAQTPPNRVVTDGLASYPRAISEVLGEAGSVTVAARTAQSAGKSVDVTEDLGDIEARYDRTHS